ncbi:MAG: PAS domain-containing protein [Betaproteobacteria bacterium]
MLIKNAKRWAPQGMRGYVVALTAFFVAFLLRYATHSVLDDAIPFLMFLVGALLVQYRYGLGPSILIALLGIPTGFFFFVKPYNSVSYAGADLSDIFVTIGYLVAFAVGIGLIELLQRARYESKLLAEVARTRYEVLLRSESERQSAVAQARETREHFRTFTASVGEVLYMRRVGGGFEYVHPLLAQITGRNVEDLMGGRWVEAMYPEDALLIQEQIALVADSRQPTLSEFRLLGTDGKLVALEGRLSAMEDERGVVVRWTGGLQTQTSFTAGDDTS